MAEQKKVIILLLAVSVMCEMILLYSVKKKSGSFIQYIVPTEMFILLKFRTLPFHYFNVQKKVHVQYLPVS